MLDEFESYFDMVDIKGLREFIKVAKKESEWIQEEEEKEGLACSEMVEFMQTLLTNIEDEIKNINDLSELDFKSKIRLYAMVHLFHDICNSVDDEFDMFNEDDYLEDDEFEEDFIDDSDEPDERNINGKGRIIKLE